MKSTFSIAFRIQVESDTEPDEGDMRRISEAIAEVALEHRHAYAALTELEDIEVDGPAYSGPPRPARS